MDHARPQNNVVNVEYAQSGKSVSTNELGMREMQQRVYEARGAQYLLIKAPPASGKSRALMFVGLDKLFNQGLRKVIVAVPERSIGGSFASTNLTEHGFFADWVLKEENNLCNPGSSAGKVEAFRRFMEGSDPILVCTHATLRFAFDALQPEAFNNCVVAIDEFHHVSADLENNRLGKLIRSIMANSNAHVIAMTGSYFRGDSLPVLDPEDEAKFTPVTFNYYDQLNGYEHLKSLGIGHHFYQGQYTDSIAEALNLEHKTIIHIPSVQSGDSTKDKFEEVGKIMDAIGVVEGHDEHGIYLVRRRDNGEILRIADLVDDLDQKARAEVLHYLSTVASKDPDAVDIIIALGMAKEGFDWPFAQEALTIGYRASLTEIIQIIGRVTRDAPGKTHAQFTNLIAQPDADDDDVTIAVNNMLKAITASLLMEQVLAPNFNFKAKLSDDDQDSSDDENTVRIIGFKEPTTDRVRQIVATDLNDLKATILQDETFAKAAAGSLDPETTNKVLIPKIIRRRYPELSEGEVEQVRQQVIADSVIKNGEVREVGDQRFIRMADKFVDIEKLNINLIDSINPFQRAFEVMSKSVTPRVLASIQDAITTSKLQITDEEAMQLWPKIQSFVKMNRKEPNPRSENAIERRLGEALLYLRDKKRRMRDQQEGAASE
ncbi:DEAD/DEAH box helicase [Corynebacterium choanae]|uniref:DEAD/DEAH box helicase n=1 Tax=Corynebacterium choanae TaxID=1862358 RepID=UPI00361CF3A9